MGSKKWVSGFLGDVGGEDTPQFGSTRHIHLSEGVAQSGVMFLEILKIFLELQIASCLWMEDWYFKPFPM